MYFDQVDCGNRVRRVRTALGYTQENVAEQLNISHSHYCNFEKGKRMLSIDALIALAALLHLPLDFMLIGQEPQNDIIRHKVRSMIEFMTAIEKEL